jgi:hypothetical protein
MDLECITASQAAKLWEITVWQMQSKCQQRQVKCAIRLGRVWLRQSCKTVEQENVDSQKIEITR